ncbi:MAG TPA: prolyl oligopeptidase family serine peptidase [Anaerolineae bacterium]|nr:prolyl oligopeptidase family serine peptidase [Anaerolineae bacterium]
MWAVGGTHPFTYTDPALEGDLVRWIQKIRQGYGGMLVKIKVLSLAILVPLIVACQSSTQQGNALPEEGSEAIALEPRLPTGVHLQALYQIPDVIEGEVSSQDEMRYLLYLPEGYWEDPDKLWPMIFFLHGAGDGEFDSTYVLSMGLPAVLYLGEQPEDFPFIVVSPQAFPGSAWWTGDTLPILNALLGEVIETYQVDPDRVYLTGLSMGGYGSWFLATAYPERFAAMVSVSGSGYRTNFIPEEETLCRLKDVPVWAIHGALDVISAPEASKLFASALQVTCGVEVKWTMYDDLGHGGAYDRAYRDPELYAWMLEQSR